MASYMLVEGFAVCEGCRSLIMQCMLAVTLQGRLLKPFALRPAQQPQPVLLKL